MEEQERHARHYALCDDMAEKLKALQKSPPEETIDARLALEASIATQKAICAKAWLAAHIDARRSSPH